MDSFMHLGPREALGFVLRDTLSFDPVAKKKKKKMNFYAQPSSNPSRL